MWRSLLWGTLLLAIAEVALTNANRGAQAGAAAKWGLRGLARLMAADVAGIPQLQSALSVDLGQGETFGKRLKPAADVAPPVPGRGQITF